MSHWLYIHKDLGGAPNVWKPGITQLPYSAVRARQKFIWDKFGLDYLFFGRPNDINFLERKIKTKHKYCSGQNLNPYGSQTEIFQVDINNLLMYIAGVIKQYQLDVKQISLEQPYSATSSGQCPFGCPSELDGWRWCKEKEIALFGEPKPSALEELFYIED